MRRWPAARLLVFALALLVMGPAVAQVSGGGDTIMSVEVVGAQRIEPETVMSYMQVKPGDRFDSQAVNDSLKALFRTGLFSDVEMMRQGSRLIVKVSENPIINRIAFEGNDRIDDDTLDQEVSLRPRVVYTRPAVQNDVQRLLALYRRFGRFGATIEPKVILLDDNRVDLIFEINEGPPTRVKRIGFVGNHAFSDGKLREEIQTVESKPWRILTKNDIYDPDLLSVDQELLRRFYASTGYPDFRILSAVAELTRDREAFVITFTLDEGPRYRYGAIDVSTELEEVDLSRLRALVTSKSGDWYDGGEVDDTVRALNDALGEQGFAFVDVRAVTNRRRDERLIDITYTIKEGPRVFVERLDIRGNQRTLDKVIRREFDLVEGDAFNTAKLRDARRKLNNLGFFRKVDIATHEGSAPDRTVVTVDVQETSTGELTFGAGFSTTAGLLADVSVRERNLLGRGQDLRLGLTLAQQQSQIDLSFTEPYFLDRRIAAGFDVFRRLTDFSQESSFDEDQIGAGLRAGYQVTPGLRHNIRYSLERSKVTNVPTDASPIVKEQEGSTISSVISNQFFLDRLDSRLNPSEGYFVRAGADFAGVGGEVHYVRGKFSAGYFVPITDSGIVASLDGEVGAIMGLGENVRLVDRFFLGGSDLRGFEDFGAGPRDTNTDDAIGGKRYFAGTFEVRFPLGLPQELGLSGSIFSDFGILTGIDEKAGSGIVDTASPRVSVGAGISWNSPLGPLRVDFAVPVVKKSFDRTQSVRINVGTRF